MEARAAKRIWQILIFTFSRLDPGGHVFQVGSRGLPGGDPPQVASFKSFISFKNPFKCVSNPFKAC